MSDRRSDIAEAVQRGADLQRALDEPLYQKAMAENARLLADLERMRAVVEAAEAWWLAHRPLEWDEEQHRATPRVNCATPTQVALADAISNLRAGRAKC